MKWWNYLFKNASAAKSCALGFLAYVVVALIWLHFGQQKSEDPGRPSQHIFQDLIENAT